MSNLSSNNIPTSLAQLQVLLNQLHHRTIGELACELNVNLPANPLHTKGLVGQLIERYLGIANNNLAQLDLVHLQLELKTIPVNAQLKPLESTYVCTVASNHRALVWEDSWVYKKLANVVWIPILYNNASLAQQIILKPIIWQPNQEVNDILAQDYLELMELFYLGHGAQLSAKFGTYLHIRPKASNSASVVNYLDSNNLATKIVPKGFYLRTQLTSKILLECS
jgi:DNA mismatch repair protein MutH